MGSYLRSGSPDFDHGVLKPFWCGSQLKSCETVPTVAAVHDFCRFRGVPKVQPAEDTQTMSHARSAISLAVRVISRSKYNFYDVIRLKIIESWYFPKETVKVGLKKSKQNGAVTLKCEKESFPRKGPQFSRKGLLFFKWGEVRWLF